MDDQREKEFSRKGYGQLSGWSYNCNTTSFSYVVVVLCFASLPGMSRHSQHTGWRRQGKVQTRECTYEPM